MQDSPGDVAQNRGEQDDLTPHNEAQTSRKTVAEKMDAVELDRTRTGGGTAGDRPRNLPRRGGRQSEQTGQHEQDIRINAGDAKDAHHDLIGERGRTVGLASHDLEQEILPFLSVPTPDQKPDAPLFRLEFPPELPISARAEEIVATLQKHPVVIVAGETGSGKTTQIPKMCLAAGGGRQGRIACTQPRRVAALSVSRRVAEELGVEWGGLVGAKIRFNDQTSPQTVIKFLTDGMLLAEVQGDPMLRAYDTIILDEAHERSLNIDFLLGHLRNLRFRRPELKIVVTSATIDTEAFSAAFDGAPIIQVSGRTYPVETIYAPLDELGSDYVDDPEEPDREAERSAKVEALHYVDGAAAAVERIVRERDRGDILVFLPSERDIRELRDQLEGGLDRGDVRRIEIVPLFGRLSNAEQQRVFASSQKRKVVLATNIAETSLTIPGIRFVIDTGLARVSCYSPQSRTRRLPIEPVSQSSADQRKGRAGRVAEGVCIRLYSEKDFNERPRFSQPEIQRANLADVILRLKAFGLGDIERFPFINPPVVKAVRSGYALLEELGALLPPPAAKPAENRGGHETAAAGAPPALRELTPVGRELARLPVDPTVGRMILQARTEKCLREVVIIAAGLSIQDPRERPLDKQAAADAAHRQFRHPDSDFLTLLAIWERYHDEFERLSQGRLRRFCHEHFLSYVRMREWRDIHAQLVDVLEQRDDCRATSVYDGLDRSRTSNARAAGGTPDVGGPRGRTSEGGAPRDPLAFGTPAYRAIHRSILAGLLGNIAQYDEENRNYKATQDRRVVLFPGSVLFSRDDSRRKESGHRGDSGSKGGGTRHPRWLMAAEIVETSRLYARTCARLDPAWALDLGSHLLRVSHSEPFWNPEAGRVMVKQRTRLYGLEIESRAVGYGKIDPHHATEIFIREGLVADTLTWPLDFLAHNRKVRAEVESILTRTRDAGYLNLDEALYRFYAEHLLPGGEGDDTRDRPGVSSVAELVDLTRERRARDPDFLKLSPENLRDPEQLAHDETAFPAALPIENRVLALQYTYRPGQEDDGVNLDVNVRDAAALTPAALDWAVPGHLSAKMEHYLRALPKELRKAFVPLSESLKSITAGVDQLSRLRGQSVPLTELLAEYLNQRYSWRIDPRVWSDKPLPDHLCVRVRVVDDEGKEVAASRELHEIKAALEKRAHRVSAAVATEDPGVWREARARWEKPESTAWEFGEVPSQVQIGDQAGVPVLAYPALVPGERGVALRLLRSQDEAAKATPRGVARLIELQLRYELAWMQKDLKALRTLGPLISTLAPVEQLQDDAYESIRRHLTDAHRVSSLTRGVFDSAVATAKEELRGLVPRFVDLLREILTLRQALLVQPSPYPGLQADLAGLLPGSFLREIPFERLSQLPRYLRALRVRAERWKQNPGKDAERSRALMPYVAAVVRLRERAVRSNEAGWQAEIDRFRWLVEEYRVSLFAQELGTAEPVSSVKLDRFLEELAAGRSVQKGQPVSAGKPAPLPLMTGPAPSPAPTKTGDKKPGPLKDLNALGNLFRGAR